MTNNFTISLILIVHVESKNDEKSIKKKINETHSIYFVLVIMNYYFSFTFIKKNGLSAVKFYCRQSNNNNKDFVKLV